MTETIVVNTFALYNYAKRICNVMQRVNTLNGCINGLNGNLKNLMLLSGSLNCVRLVSKLDFSALAACQEYLLLTMQEFNNAEQELCGCDPADFTPPPNSKFRIEPFILPTLVYNSRIAGVTSEVTTEFGKYEDKKSLGKALGINIEQEKIKPKDLQINPDEKWYEKTGTIFEKKKENKIEGSVGEISASGANEWAEGSIDVKAITGEAHSEYAAGLYVYEKDNEGNVKRIFSPGVSAEVGVSCAAIDASGEGRIGFGRNKKTLGAYGDFDAKALSGEAKAKFAANRKEVYGELSAEADLVKVSGTAGVSVLGTDIGVTGSVKVGFGAHAKIGYTDKKLKFDIGASFGLGFDVGFEIDVGGTVDAVVDTAKSWIGGVKNVIYQIF